MPTRMTVEKHHSLIGEYWTNVYHRSGFDVTSVEAWCDAVVAAERPLYTSHTIITKVRVDDATADTDVGFTKVYNQTGSKPGATAETQMPLFNRGRVDFTVADGGRPCRKFLACLQDGDVAGHTMSAGMLVELNSYATKVVAAGCSDPQGSPITSGAAHPKVGMRQMRRGSKKKDTPSSPGTPL